MFPESLRLLEQNGFPDAVKEDCLRIARELGEQDFSWERFVAEATEKWGDFIPSEAPREEEWKPYEEEWEPPEGKFSFLVPHKFRPPEDFLRYSTDSWRAFLRGETELHPFLVISGTMGVGKSALADSLKEYLPPLGQNIFINQELWQLVDPLKLFYTQLSQGFCDPEMQARIQSTFASIKLLQELWAMSLLRYCPVAQEVDIRQDRVYFKTQIEELGLRRAGYVETYLNDNNIRMGLMPPYLKQPILVYIWAPLEVIKQRLGKRGREMEQRIGPDYIARLHLNTLQWVIAMKKAGVPVLFVNSQIADFSGTGRDREMVVKAVWQQVQDIHPGLVKEMREKWGSPIV